MFIVYFTKINFIKFKFKIIKNSKIYLFNFYIVYKFYFYRFFKSNNENFNLNLYEVYEYRKLNFEQGVFAYLIPWVAKVFLPFSLAYCFIKEIFNFNKFVIITFFFWCYI